MNLCSGDALARAGSDDSILGASTAQSSLARAGPPQGTARDRRGTAPARPGHKPRRKSRRTDSFDAEDALRRDGGDGEPHATPTEPNAAPDGADRPPLAADLATPGRRRGARPG